MAQPSGLSMHMTLMGRISPLLHQPGSMTYSPPTSATMGGEYGPTAAPPMPSARASLPDHLAKGSMAPLPATSEAATSLPSLAHPSMSARSYPSHPHQTMGGIPVGSMAPLPATTEVATPSPSLACPFLPTWSSPTHPLAIMGGSAALAACRALECIHQRLAFDMSKHPGFADANQWVMETINAVTRELQCWYQRHSIRGYLARQTRQRLAATTLQCWKRRIWLSCWFAQQAEQCQRCLRLRSLCRGASAYTVLVRGDRQPPPTPTDKTSNPKVLPHSFWDRGLPLS
jgi:hypothetical protein